MRVHTKPRCVNELRTMELVASICDIGSLHVRMREMISEGWSIYCVDQRRGMMNPVKRYITIPSWALSRAAGYWVYYVAHEMAHTCTYLTEVAAGNRDGHGPAFMEELKRICPKEYWHHELEYMRDDAECAGITREHAHGAKNLKVIDILDLL